MDGILRDLASSSLVNILRLCIFVSPCVIGCLFVSIWSKVIVRNLQIFYSHLKQHEINEQYHLFGDYCIHFD